MSLEPKIKFDSEIYSPGQEITGKALIETTKDHNVRKIVISFIGRAVNAWDKKKSSGKPANLKAEEKFVEMVHEVWVPENEKHIFPAGEYEWDFSFELPAHCPPSYESEFGHIRYSVNISLDVPHAIDTSVTRAVTVSPTVDLNTIPEARNIIRLEGVVNLTCCVKLRWKQGTASYMLNIPKTGYVAGETISVTGLVANHGRGAINALKCSLIRRTSYKISEEIRKAPARKNKGFANVFDKFSDVILSEVDELSLLPPGQERPFSFELKIPSTVSSIRTPRYLNVDYLIRVTGNSAGAFISDSKIEAPIVLGNVPLFEEGTAIPSPTFVPSARGAEDTKTWITGFGEEPFIPKYPVYSNLPIYKI